jgi:hypothetical protein
MQQAPTVELSNILTYSLNAKYALAFLKAQSDLGVDFSQHA